LYIVIIYQWLTILITRPKESKSKLNEAELNELLQNKNQIHRELTDPKILFGPKDPKIL
jgi:hypothetical protein